MAYNAGTSFCASRRGQPCKNDRFRWKEAPSTETALSAAANASELLASSPYVEGKSMKKSDVFNLLRDMPDDLDTEELIYRLYLKEKIGRASCRERV